MAMTIEAEVAVLAACLRDNRAIFEAAALCSPDDFAGLAAGTVWRAMLAAHAERLPVDPATVIPRINRDHDALEAFGQALDSGYSSANVAVYAGAVRDAALKRRVLGIAAEFPALAQDAKGSELVSLGIDRLTALQTTQRGNAVRFSDAFSQTERQIREMRERRRRGELVGAPTGIKDLDDALGGVFGPKLIIMAARPSVGKTAVLNLASTHMAGKGFAGLVHSLEMSTDALVTRALAAQAQWNVTEMAMGEGEALDRGAEAYAAIGDIPLWIDCDTYDLAGICAQAAMHRHKHGIQWVAVDHIGLVETPKFNSRNDQLGHVSRTLKQLAKRLGIPVIALSQLSRECERDRRRPTLSDLRDSGNLEQDADQVVFLHSPYDQKHEARRALEFGVLKNRGGRTGWIEGYRFDGATQRVLERWEFA